MLRVKLLGVIVLLVVCEVSPIAQPVIPDDQPGVNALPLTTSNKIDVHLLLVDG